MRLLFIVLFLLLKADFSANAQRRESFDHYNMSSGLSHNTVTGIVQDETGYVWIGTSSGLNRFDGSRFVQFHSNSDSASLITQVITGMQWLDRHRLAVFSTGVHILDTRTGSSANLFIPYHDRQYGYKFNMIVQAEGDENGDIFILSRSGFYHFGRDHQLLSRFDYYREDEVPFTHFFFGRNLFVIDSVHMLIVAIDGLYIYSKRKRKLEKMNGREWPLLAEFGDYIREPITFFQYRPGTLLAFRAGSDSVVHISFKTGRRTVSGTGIPPGKHDINFRSRLAVLNDSIFAITGHNAGFYRLYINHSSGGVKMEKAPEFSSGLCTALMQDREGALWIGTKSGLYRRNRQKSRVEAALLPGSLTDAFPDIRVNDIHVTEKGIYAAARGGAGMLLFDNRDHVFRRQFLTGDVNGNANHMRTLVPFGNEKLLVATNGPLMVFDMKNNSFSKLSPPGWVEGDWASDLYTDSRGDIWIGSRNIYRYRVAERKFDRLPYHPRLLTMPSMLAEDTSGNIWMAGHGLARFNTARDSFDLLIDSFPFIRLPDRQVNSMIIDQRNTIWFNSNNNGLIAYDIEKGLFRHFTKKDGLPDENIASFIILGNQLWIACFSGIACMDLRTFRIMSIGKSDGFPEMTVERGSRFYHDRASGLLYLGLSGAVIRFSPHEVLGRISPPHLFIENIVIGDRNSFLPSHELSTNWSRNEISVTIGTINFSDAPQQRFAYRLLRDPLTAWTYLGSQTSFSISGLEPGKHRIQVKTWSVDNRWPEQVMELGVVVSPPFWREPWFLAAASVIALALLWMLIRWRTGVVRRKEMEKTQMEKLKADDYKNRYELEQISHYFSSSMADKKSEEEVMWDVASNLIGNMNYEDCVIYGWNEDRTKMVQKAAFGPKGQPGVIARDGFEVEPGQGIVGNVILTRRPELVHDTRSDSRYRVDDRFRLSEICVPIIHNGELLGVIDCEHHLPGYFRERDIKILTTIATLLGNKIRQLESEKVLEAKRQELAGINEQLAEARFTALQAQMNPHFVFNALNSIKRMILDNENNRASRYLSKFAMMIRMTLDHSRQAFVTLDENIVYLNAYLEMEQLRFDDSFSYSIHVDEDLDTAEISVPSMMIQPLVENAIWHGLLPSMNGKMIRIGFAKEGDTLICTVEDNGIGIRRSEELKKHCRPTHQSVGLENMRKRLRVLNEKYGMHCRLTITDLEEMGTGKGTRVVIQLVSHSDWPVSMNNI